MKKVLGFPFLVLFSSALTLLSGVALSLYFQQNPITDPLVSRIALIICLALVAGIGARVVLKNYHWFWRILASGIGLVASLWTLDRFFNNPYIINFFNGGFDQPIPRDFLQVGSGFLLALLVGSIGTRRKPKPVELPRRTMRVVEKKASKAHRRVKTTSRKLVKKKVTKPLLKRKTLQKVKSVSLAIKQRVKRREKVMLKGETEHRCPYCMEIVKKNDLRGVVICPECKTWHHKDCWDITGTCQVAHRHDL